jgi:hypothetical protein
MHRYKYTLLLIGTFLAAWAVGEFGYLDALAGSAAKTNQILYSFIAGALYSFSFTAAFAVILFSNLTIPSEAILPLSVVAALGQVAMDITLLRFIKGFMAEELTSHAKKVVARFTSRKPVRLLLQIFGALVIISPLPEEVGLTLLGISHLSFWRIITITFFLDIIGAYIIITLVANIL